MGYMSYQCIRLGSCIVLHLSTLENEYSNIFFYKTTGPTVLRFHMEHDLTPGSENCEIGSGQISKLAAITNIKAPKGTKMTCSMTDRFSFEVSLSLNCTDQYKREGGA